MIPPRIAVAGGIIVAMLLSVILPTVGITGQGGGRWLVPAGSYFLGVLPVDIPATAVSTVAAGVNVVYLGLGLQQLGLVVGAVSVWVLGGQDMNRWLYAMAMACGVMMTLAAPTMVLGYLLLRSGGAAATVGLAFLPCLAAGLTIIVFGVLSFRRIDRSWYVARPELQ